MVDRIIGAGKRGREGGREGGRDGWRTDCVIADKQPLALLT